MPWLIVCFYADTLYGIELGRRITNTSASEPSTGELVTHLRDLLGSAPEGMGFLFRFFMTVSMGHQPPSYLCLLPNKSSLSLTYPLRNSRLLRLLLIPRL